MSRSAHTITIRMWSMSPFKSTIKEMLGANKTPGDIASNGLIGPHFIAELSSGDELRFDPSGKCLGHVQTGKVELHVTPKSADGWTMVRNLIRQLQDHETTPEDAGHMANKVVAQWEARGAFDEVEESAEIMATFKPPIVVRIPFRSEVAQVTLARRDLLHDVLVADHPTIVGASLLIAQTERGRELCKSIVLGGFATTMRNILVVHDNIGREPELGSAAAVNAPTIG